MAAVSKKCEALLTNNTMITLSKSMGKAMQYRMSKDPIRILPAVVSSIMLVVAS
ncbi:hypothetical protein AGABI1DRAFT_82077 [Agaricus bisporus var. burnettii JB137-S8]|uniref:Uncharacterized protein n=1 Tax=Agaricus bisporus var. burnettii (strain JB137-S8 / ATCC MYA-4627 / FGSC 10392) TaxID=597362 RepID=K5WBY6_AGABU|nr:uncharacterized protein AGABI1DRAFT_82077 [Agaricus bisporus var. burnettii JB137-S8]EKM84414.1 hypothetical protein AGABI1DRAFT_82077 [Agaricus bisporus var. burnettii JB137-S8]